MYNMYAADTRARINLGIRRRLAPLMENDLDRVKLMKGMLLSMPGSPIIYYGDEIGMGDNVFVGDRNGVRTPMQWSPDRNAGFSRADPQRLYLQPIMDAMYGYEALNVETQARDQSSLLNWTRRMLAVRKTSHAFGRGKRTFLKPGNRKILAYLSEYEDDVILTVFNLSRAAQPVELNLGAYKGRAPVEMLGRTTFPPIGELPYLLTLPSYGFYWFRLSADAEIPAWHQDGLDLQERPVLVLFDSWTSFFRDQVMPWRMSMAERMRIQLETDTLPRFVELQRWYAGKGSTVQRARIQDHAIWTDAGHEWMLPLLLIEGPDEPSTYFLPLALAWEETDEERMKQLAPGGLARVRQQANVGVMGDAFHDEAFCRAVVRAMGANLELGTEHGRLRFRPTAEFARIARNLDDLPVGRPGAQSSNTVVTFDETLFLKGYRRLRQGLNPELEMGRYLTEVARFPNCVPVAGALEYTSNDGTQMTLALVQAYVSNQGDGWDYTLGYLERFLEEMRIAPSAELPADVHGGYLALAATLGTRTAQLHQALALRSGYPSFDPEPLTAQDVAAFRQRAAAEATETLALLERRWADLPAPAQADAQALLARRHAILERINAAADGAPSGVKTRFHGDYHLGQVLVTGNDFVIIDFEGEPGRSFEQRRTKGSPLRDVAGMLRSFNYARWAALKHTTQSTEEAMRLDTAVQQWEQASRAAFLNAYHAQMGGSDADRRTAERLLAVFELEKAVYELRYELGNRVDWVQVPLQGLLALAGAMPDAQP